ncbi:MAG: preprotein translocase subunit SecE [Desulfobacteraceae bacterium]|nr:MAG: preprotein translocase subunit SecE [Desulfobacteraceae bacterium]
MARLQKKKAATDKKKTRTSSEESPESGISSEVVSSGKAAAISSPKKPIIEKSAGEVKKGEPNFFEKAVEFFREVKIELKKVTWPTRKQTTGTTIVVIVFVIVVSIFLGIFDYALSKLVQVVLT